jgi:hypothetical protein
MKKVAVLICIGWLLGLFKHFIVLPVVDWEEHEVTGVEFKLRF